MKKRLYFIAATLVVFNTTFGCAYKEEDFNRIPKLAFLNAKERKTLITGGSITRKNRTWNSIPFDIQGATFNAAEFWCSLKPNDSLCPNEGSEYCLRYTKLVSRRIDSSFAENPLIQLTRIVNIRGAIGDLVTRSGYVLDMTKQTTFPKKPR